MEAQARIFRTIAAGVFIQETNAGVYAANSIPRALVEPANAAMFEHS